MSATALTIKTESSSEEKEMWPELEGSFDILFGEGGKMLIESVGEGGVE